MTNSQFDVIIFDVGGVLVELTGVDQMLSWCGGALTKDELWSRWLSSPGVRAFETGRGSAADFGASIVQEFALSVGPDEYLKAFTHWPRGLYPGAADLLRSLAPRYQLATLSNTNELHWNYVCDELGLGALFNRHFPSHLTGLIKPDREVFDHIVQSLGGPAERMLFLDDNQLNIDAALSVGLRAERVFGVSETAERLQAMGIA